MKILIVDDEEINVMLIKEMIDEYLKEIGMFDSSDIDLSYDGEDALQKAKANGYDLIFMDVMMPKVDGFEATKQIRMLSLKKQPIVIMITALDDSNAMREGFFSGVNWYLTKPVNLEELEVLINDVVAGKILSNNSKKILNSRKKLKKATQDNKVNDDDEFFEFESEEVDENIYSMHNLNETVSASEFMKEGLIDDEDLSDLKEALEEYHYNINSNKEEFIAKVDRLLQSFVKLLNHTYVFRNLAYGLQNLSVDIDKSSFTAVDDDKFDIYKIMLEAVIFDLEKWVDEVLIRQSAVDIHYLDAAILANVAQVDMLLKHN